MSLSFEVPPVVEDALHAAARARLPPEVLSGAALTAAVVDRSRRYTSEREKLASPGGGRAGIADLAARALFFTVADAAKVQLPLAELTRGILPAPAGFLAAPELRVLDLGAGCGAMTLGLLTFLAGRDAHPRLRITLVDQDAAALQIAAAASADVARALGLDASIETRTADVATFAAPAPFDLVLAGSVLNELDDAAAESVAAAMIAALAPGGAAIIVEPALRATTRALHVLRDRLLDTGRAAVLAPCTRKGAPCPALADPDDWCHDHRPLRLPPRARQLATVTGLRDGDLKVAYLALARPADAPPPPGTWRVVSDPRGSKGKQELTLCGDPGWVAARLLNRHRSVANRAFERARRGDVLAVDPSPEAAGPLDLETGADVRPTTTPKSS